MYILIGRTKNYAWSLTSAGHDVRDVFAERLCNQDGSKPTRTSTHYLLQGQVPGAEELQRRHCWTASALKYKVSVHGPVIGTATVDGKPYALSRKRSTFGRDGLNLGAAQGHDRGQGLHAEEVLQGREPVRLHLQLGVRVAARPRRSSRPACLPKRARGTRPAPAHTRQRQVRVARLPLARASTRTTSAGPSDLLLNWNNHSAPGFMHGDDEPYGSVQRVELFDKWPGPAAAARRGGRDEPRRHRGRALAGVAGREPGARAGTGAERARPAGGRHARRLGPARCSAAGRRQRRELRRAGPGDHGRGLDADRGDRDAPVCGDLLDDLERRAQPGRARRRVLRGQGPAHACSATGAGQVPPPLLRQRQAQRPAGASLWTSLDTSRQGSGQPPRARSRPSGWRRRGRTGVHPGPDPEHRCGPRTARRSSRCWSSSAEGLLAGGSAPAEPARARGARGRRRCPRRDPSSR